MSVSSAESCVLEIASGVGASAAAALAREVAAREVTVFDVAFDFTAFVATASGSGDWDNTDVVRDLSFHCIAGAESRP